VKACCLEAYNEAYNRGREEAYNRGREDKEQEIIKLLEQRLYPIYYPKSKLTGSGEGELIGEIIVLINGENK